MLVRRLEEENKVLMGRTAQRFAGASFDVGWIGAFGWLAVSLILLAMHSLLVVSPWNHYILVQEDGWVENLTAVAYLLAGALLLAAAWAETRRAPRFVFLAGSVAMAFIAGEEISWGQRIWDFPTPDFLARNDHGEFNVHNLPHPVVTFLQSAFSPFMMLLCLTTVAALFKRKASLFGISLPSLPLLLALLAIPYVKVPAASFADDADIQFWFALFRRWKIAALLLLAAWALFCKRPALVLAAAANITLHLTCFHVHRQHNENWLTGKDWETFELLWGLFFLFYAAEILHGVRRRAADSVPLSPKSQASEGGKAFPRLPAISWLVLAGCAGLLALAHGNVRMERPELEAALRAVRFAAPDIRAEFDLHLADGKLTYFKEPCDQADANAGRFFLHIFAKDEANLPPRRRRFGFENLDFPFFAQGARIRGSCVAVASLPDYPIASIRTGQFRDEQQFWNARLLMNELNPAAQ